MIPAVNSTGARNRFGVAFLIYLVVLLLVTALPLGAVAKTPEGFTSELRVTADDESSYFPEMVVDVDNNIHLLWLNSTGRNLDRLEAQNGQIFYTKISPFGDVKVPAKRVVPIFPDDGGSYSITPLKAGLDGNGDIHVTWSDNHDGTFTVYYMKLDGIGDVLVPVTGLTNTTSAKYPDLAVDRQDNVHIAWAQWEIFGQSQTYPNIYYTKLDNDGEVLVPRVDVTTTFLASNHPAIAVDYGLRAHIVFEENVNLPGNTDDIYYCVVNSDGDLEVYMERVSSTMGSSLRPDIGVDQIGIPHVIWMDNQIGSMNIYYTSLSDLSSISPLKISDTVGESWSPKMFIGKGIDIHIVWSQNIYVGPAIENSRIWYAVVDDTGAIEQDGQKLTSDGLGAKAPAVHLDDYSNIIVAWDDYRDYDGAEKWEIYYTRTVVGTNLEPVDILEIDGVAADSSTTLEYKVGDKMVLFAGNSSDPNAWDDVGSYNFTIGHDNFTITSGWTENATFSYEFEESGIHIIYVKVMDKFGYKNSVPTAVKVDVTAKRNSQQTSILDNPAVTTTVVASGIGITAVLGYLIGGTEVGKFKFASLLLVPLYSRIRKEKTLDNYIRGQIHGYVLAKPGCHYNQIKQTLNLNNGTLAYHLRKLEREEFIKSERDGMYKRFYPIGLKIPKRTIKLSAMQKRILEAIAMNPGISQKEVANEVGISAPAVIYHIGVLSGAKLVKREKKGSRVEYKIIDRSEDDDVPIVISTPASTQ